VIHEGATFFLPSSQPLAQAVVKTIFFPISVSTINQPARQN